MNTKWQFYKLINLTVWAVLLKNVPIGCKNAVLPKPLRRSHPINCFRYEANARQPDNFKLCLFRALALNLSATQRLEGNTAETFSLFSSRLEGQSPTQLQGVNMNDILSDENLLTINIPLYDINIANGKLSESLLLCRNMRNVQKLRFNNHICYVIDNITVFQSNYCPNFDTFFNRTSNLERTSTSCSERVKHA